MTEDIVRRIRGNLYGSIDISELEDKVIAHPVFQRLRRIKQTAFLSFVFPGASHTRFEHSLGVMHLAERAWKKLYENQKRLERSCQRIPSFAHIEQVALVGEGLNHGLLAPTFPLLDKIFTSDYIRQALRLAALMHDIGHPPFSHSGERFLPKIDQVIAGLANLPPYLDKYLEALQADPKRGSRKAEGPVSHEVYTVLLLDKVLNEVYAQHQHVAMRIEPQDVASIIAPIIPSCPESPLARYQARQLCHELVSGEIDIDRMDYLQRDSQECGVVYGMFDDDRILDSLALYYDPKEQSPHLAIQFSGLAAFEDYLRARQSMYLQLYFHKTSVACEAMLQSLQNSLGDWHLPVGLSEYIAIDECNLTRVLVDAAKALIVGKHEQQRFCRLVEDLFLHRRLWKRVYEYTRFGKQQEEAADLALVETTLQRLAVPYELVSSSNHLTRFRTRKHWEKSKNYLRLIKKDGKQFLRVVPIEDYSHVIASEAMTHIQRVYVASEDEARVRDELFSSFYVH